MKPIRSLLSHVSIMAAGCVLLAAFAHAQSMDPPAEDIMRAGTFDNGKMWTFEYAPADYFSETYDFDASEEWFARARLGSLRIPNCTASFVSSYGLVLTNHHCSRGPVTSVTREGEDLLENGFYASSLEAERRVPDYYAEQLIAISDVTEEILSAQNDAQTDAERIAARDEAIAAVEMRIGEEAGGEDAGIVVQVVPLYHGGRYSAYTFRRYDDVRLVMTPELKIGYYGGDADNFTYPRYTLDITLFRVYDENGQPFETSDYFTWSLEGSKNGDPVFVVGNPGSTSRLETIAQLEVRRDVTDKSILAFYSSRADVLGEAEVDDPAINNLLFSLLNARKAITGQLKALHDPVIMARRMDAERHFRSAIEDSAGLQEAYGGALDEMKAIQEQKREFAAPYGAFLGLTHSVLSSSLMRRAIAAYLFFEGQESGADAVDLSSLEPQLEAIQDRDLDLEEALLAARLKDVQDSYGADHNIPSLMLGEDTPVGRATALLAESALATAQDAKTAVTEGTLTADDPAIQMVAAFIQDLRDYQSGFAGLNAQEDRWASTLGRARFDVYGTAVPPDATFSLRIADGVVQGYAYNGTIAAPYTNFYGLYDHFYSYGPDSDWGLPDRWLSPPASFEYAVPLNFVSTNDIIGGNSGSPVLNKDLELVGLIFDGNIESLSGDYIYLPETARSISVDARGILEALDEIYDADRIVLELTRDVLAETEDQADSTIDSLQR